MNNRPPFQNEFTFFNSKTEEFESENEEDESINLAFIQNDLGEEIAAGDGKKAFDIAMNTAAILLPSGAIRVKNMINGNHLFARDYEYLCTTGIASCHALVGIGHSNKGIVIFLSHSDESPFIAESMMQKWMRKAGVDPKSIFIWLIGGTAESRKEIKDFINDHPRIPCVALNQSYKGGDKTDECTVLVEGKTLVINQFHGLTEKLKDTIKIDLLAQPKKGNRPLPFL